MPGRQPDEPVEIHLPAERPHLAETRVMPQRRPGEDPPPLSRAAAEQDTAEFRAVHQDHEPPADEGGEPHSSNSA
jgi:hypothetical protein